MENRPSSVMRHLRAHSTADQVATLAQRGVRVRLPSWEWVLFAAGMLIMLTGIIMALTGRL
jgi:hypothetical protein